MEKFTRIYGGVDVGAKGGIAFLNEDGSILMKEAIPVTKDVVDYAKLFDLMTVHWSNGHEVGHIVIEDVHSIFGTSAKSNFNFGFIKGVKVGYLEILQRDYGLPYSLVQPKRWQKGVWEDKDIVWKPNMKRPTKDTKATSLNAANRLWPGADFTKSTRAYKPHDGIIDALLMAEFARTHLNK